MRFLRKLQFRLRRDERGAAMTEFVMFLPAWVIVFMGVFSLGKMAIETTKVKMIAQKNLWDAVIPITNSAFEINEHMSPRVAGPTAAAHLGGLAGNSANDQQVQDGVEAAIMGGGQGIFGHWGESYGRVKPFQLVGSVADFAQVDDLTFQGGTDILDDRTYPKQMLDDSIPTSAPSSGLAGILSAVLGATGIMPAIGAGIRYGEVFGEVEGHQYTVSGRGTVTASAHYDILVAPAALTGESTKISELLAYALAQTNDNYFDLFYFGENNYGGSSTSGGSHDPGGAISDSQQDQQDGQDEVEEDYEELCGDFSSQSECERCRNAGYSNQSDCDNPPGD